MSDRVAALVAPLGKWKWHVRIALKPMDLPDVIRDRYDWLPDEYVELLSMLEEAAASDEKSWLISVDDFESDVAFRWNQWELDSIEAAGLDNTWKEEIKSFWDRHFPFLLSVRDGYRYVAISTNNSVVGGAEPEFEETEVLADSIADFFQRIDDPEIAKYL